MKRKTIKAILAKKHRKWAESIKDEEVRELVFKNTVITGGCITSMLLNEKVNDFDVYFTNKETAKRVAQYYIGQWSIKNKAAEYYMDLIEDEDRIKIYIRSIGVDGKKEDKELSEALKSVGLEDKEEEFDDEYRPVFFTSNAITLSDDIQIVTRFFGEPEEIHETYDFVHTKCYWRSDNCELTLPAESLEAIINKELKYVGSHYPLASLFRMRKFLLRDWQINVGEILKIAFQINQLNLTDINVLEEQLIGVDVSYFNMLIRKLKEQEDDFGYTFISNLIEEIFS